MTSPEKSSRAQQLLRSYPVRLVGTIALVVTAAVVAAQMGLLTEEATPSSTARASRPAPPATPIPGQITAGAWRVGADVAPGTYITTGAVPERDGRDGYCMWSRHSSTAGGPMDDIIASDGDYGTQQMLVTINPSDVLFRTDGCNTWEKIS